MVAISKQGARKRALRPGTVIWLAVAPAAIALVTLLGYPIIQGVILSFSEWNGVGDPKPVGFTNYQNIFSEPSLGRSSLLTLGYAVATTFGVVAVATILAAAVGSRVRGSAFYRVVWFLPAVAPASAAAVFWAASFNPGYGAVNRLLGVLGLGSDHAWLADSKTAIYPVIFVAIWSGVGTAYILILGAVEQVPVSVYEAAQIDGASPLRQFFSITLPLIRPVLVIVSMLSIIGASNGFSSIYGMTRGGPANATETLPILIYTEAFRFSRFGVASALALLSGIVLVVLGALALRFSRSTQEGK